MIFQKKYKIFLSTKCAWVCCLQNYSHFVQAQCVNSLGPGDAYMRHWTGSSLVQVMACRLFGAKQLPEPMLANFQVYTLKQTSLKLQWKTFSLTKMHSKMSSAKWQPFCFSLNVLIFSVWWPGTVGKIDKWPYAYYAAVEWLSAYIIWAWYIMWHGESAQRYIQVYFMSGWNQELVSLKVNKSCSHISQNFMIAFMLKIMLW